MQIAYTNIAKIFAQPTVAIHQIGLPLDEHFRVEGRRTRFESVEEMQTVLDEYLVHYNTKRPHQGRNMNRRTPAQAFKNSLHKCQQKKEKSTSETKAAKPASTSDNCQVNTVSVHIESSLKRFYCQ